MTKEDLGDRIGSGLAQAAEHQHTGETDTAIRILDDLEQQARHASHSALPYILIQKAGWLRELGRLDEARPALQEAETLALATPTMQGLLPSLRMEQGIVAVRANDFPRAESLLKEAQILAAGSPIELLMMSDILANLSTVYSEQGRIAEARTALSAAIEYDMQTQDPRALSSNLNMLGLLYMDAGDAETARVYLTQSKTIAAEAGLAKELADATHNLAILDEKQGRITEARAGFSDALAAATRSGRQEDVANAKSSLGIVAARDGRFSDARELLTGAHEIHSRLRLAEFTAIDLMNLAEVDLSLKDSAAAGTHAATALELVERHGLIPILWAAHYCVAKTRAAGLKHQMLAEQPTPGTLDDVLASYTRAADAIELLRGGIGRPEERERLLVNKEMVYEEAMVLAGLLGRGDLAWSFAERARGRAFVDSLGALRVERQSEKHPLATRRSALTKQILDMEGTVGGERDTLLEELRFVRSRISAEAPAIAAVTEAELPGLPDVAAAIPDDTAIVEFFLGPGKYLTVFVLNQEGLESMQTVDLGPQDLAGRIEQFRAELQYGVAGEPTGAFLFTLLFGSIWNVLKDVGRLFIVPHKQLHYLPFAALWFRNSGDGPEHLYLCQRFQTTIVPSTSYLLHLGDLDKKDMRGAPALVLGNPTQDLPASASEAGAISRLLKTSPLLGKDAVRAQVLAGSQKLSVVHIASHGIYDKVDPLLSGVVLADGRLSVEDLLEARIPADLLTLSGCVTGMSMQAPGDELIGLSRAALAAGVPSVVTTLWEVQDDSTRVFFEQFYGYLSGGMNKDAALVRTQHDMLADPQYSSPAHWAPYVLIGDCR